jgi:heterodisulfide reductase subunit B
MAAHMYYSQLMTLAYGGTAMEAGLDGHVIRAKKLEEIAVKVINTKK